MKNPSTLRYSAIALVVIAGHASAQFAQSGPVRRQDSLERCTSRDEAGCDQGFVKVAWPKAVPGTCGRPAFIPSLLPAGFVGHTSVRFELDADGKVQDLRVDYASGVKALDDALLNAARTCKFEAGMRASQPSAMSTFWMHKWEQSPKLQPTFITVPTPSPRPPASGASGEPSK
ncbi:energy transducer TonB [Pelomonas sp. V22]|nr:energy transducer TonB [Pelomonas sp. V22]